MARGPTRSVPARGRARGEAQRAILRAAERIFAEEGLAGARTDAIAEAARVNKALLYYYFRSKEALYVAVLEEHLRDFRQQAAEALRDGSSARARLLAYVRMHFEFVSRRPYYPRLLQRFMMAGGRSLERLARKYFLPVGRALTRVIERGVQAGELRDVDSRQTAISLVALTAFYFSAAPLVRLVAQIDPYAEHQLVRRKEEVLKFVRHGLFRHPEARVP